MSSDNKKSMIIVTPSVLIARGLEAIFSTLGEFRVQGIITDLSGAADTRLRTIDADVIVIDPSVLDLGTRGKVRQILPDSSDAALIALRATFLSDEEVKQYDETINLYDSPVTIVKRLRSAVASLDDKPKFEGEELSAREKEILVCVAKGMLNKEIADYFNLSIYTVITHRKNITRKTGIKSVAGLTVYALLNKLIDTDNIE